jgi:hypothetical protein
MGVIRIHIEELVVDGFAAHAVELPASVGAQVSEVLVERGLAPDAAARTSAAIGVAVAQAVGGVSRR